MTRPAKAAFIYWEIQIAKANSSAIAGASPMLQM